MALCCPVRPEHRIPSLKGGVSVVGRWCVPVSLYHVVGVAPARCVASVIVIVELGRACFIDLIAFTHAFVSVVDFPKA